MKRLIVILLTLLLLWASTAQAAARFVGTRTTKKLHDSTHSACRQYIKQTKKGNRIYFKSKKAGIQAGYKPCKKC